MVVFPVPPLPLATAMIIASAHPRVTLVALSPGGSFDSLELTSLEAFDYLPRCAARTIDVHRQIGCVERLESMRAKIATDDRIYF
jgi:hypothetical protein